MTGKRYGDQFRNGQMMLQPSINDQQWRLKWSFWVLGSDGMLNYICWLAIEICIVLVYTSVQCNINWAFMFGAIEWHVINTWYHLTPSFHYFKSSNLCDRKPFAICTNLHLMYFAICGGWCWWRKKQTSVFSCCCSIGVKKWKYSHFARCFTVRIEECGSAQWPVHWVQCTVGSGSALSQCTRHSAQWAGSKISQKTPWQPPCISPMEGQWWWWWWLDVRSWGTGQWSLWW